MSPKKLDSIKRTQREAFAKVLDSCNNMRSVLGSTQTIDYSKLLAGSGGSQSNSDGHAFKMIDYTVDVLKAVKDTLTLPEMTFFNNSLKDQIFDFPVQTVWYMRLQEKLGRVFIERKLYPVVAYFDLVKK